MYFSNFSALILLFGTFLSEGKVLSSNIYQQIEIRSHGCGKNPLYKVLENIPAVVMIDGNTHDMLGEMTLKKVIDFLEQNELIDEVFIEELKLYDDCIRTADGMRYRKSQMSELSEAYAAFIKENLKHYNKNNN